MSTKKVEFKPPKNIKHREARKVICDIVKELSESDKLVAADIPQLHRMATAYDCYLVCVDVIAKKGMTMKNIKGEEVKRPEANLMRENWSQYLEIAKEYGLTAKSRGQIKAFKPDQEISPLDNFLKEKKK